MAAALPGAPAQGISVVPPQTYANRFSKFILQHFTPLAPAPGPVVSAMRTIGMAGSAAVTSGHELFVASLDLAASARERVRPDRHGGRPPVQIEAQARQGGLDEGPGLPAVARRIQRRHTTTDWGADSQSFRSREGRTGSESSIDEHDLHMTSQPSRPAVHSPRRSE